MIGWCFIADFCLGFIAIFFAWASSPILLGLHRQFCFFSSGFLATVACVCLRVLVLPTLGTSARELGR
jgi:hypothetical protein